MVVSGVSTTTRRVCVPLRSGGEEPRVEKPPVRRRWTWCANVWEFRRGKFGRARRRREARRGVGVLGRFFALGVVVGGVVLGVLVVVRDCEWVE